MLFQEKILQKILSKSSSYNYYKNTYQLLDEKLITSENDKIKLNKLLDEKKKDILDLKKQLINQEEKFIFSIIVAIYNSDKYLSDAINSIINQSFGFKRVQIILVDDGSTDNCKNICLEYVKKYPNNIQYIHQENQGSSVARTNCLNYANGKFINFLDSGYKLELNYLDEIFTHFIMFDDEIEVISIQRHTFEAVSIKMYYYEKYKTTRIVNIFNEFHFPINPVI